MSAGGLSSDLSLASPAGGETEEQEVQYSMDLDDTFDTSTHSVNRESSRDVRRRSRGSVRDTSRRSRGGDSTASTPDVDVSTTGRRQADTRDLGLSEALSSSRGVVSAAREDDTVGVASAAGETALNLATGGEAQDFREDLQAENPVDQYRAAAQEGLDEGGLWGNSSAAFEVTKSGFDAGLDAPGGRFNVQEETSSRLRSATGADDQEELAAQSQSTYERYADARDSIPERLGTEDTLTNRVASTAYEWVIEDPVKAGYTAATGIDPETGETNARANPIDLLDPLLFGGGKAVKFGARGARAARGLRAAGAAQRADDTAAAAGRVSQAGGPGSAAGPGAGAGAGAGAQLSLAGAPRAAAAAAGVAGDSMVKGISRLGKALRRGARTGEDAVRGVDTSSIGSTNLPAVRGGNSAGALDEGVPQGALPDTTGTASIDEVIDGASGADDTFDASRSVGDGIGSATDDAAGAAGAADESAPLGSNLGPDLGGGVSAARSAASRGASRVRDAFSGLGRAGTADDGASLSSRLGRSVDETTDATSGTDDGSSSIWDNLSRSADDSQGRTRTPSEGTPGRTSSADGSRGFPDGSSTPSSGADDAGRSLTARIGSWWNNRSRKFKVGAGLLGATATLDTVGIDIGDFNPWGGGGGDKQAGDYRADAVDTYTLDGEPMAGLYRVQQGSSDSDWQTIGFAILLGESQDGTLGPAGKLLVLGSNARPTPIQPLAGSQARGNAVPRGRFGSREEADAAFERFVAWLREEYGNEKGDEEKGDPDDHPNLDGDIDLPSEIPMGEAFEAPWALSLSGRLSESSGRITLALAVEGGLAELSEGRYTIGGDVSSDEGTFTVPGGWGGIEPGDYTAYALVYEDSQRQGAVAETDITVLGPDGGTPGGGDPEDAWGEPEMVEELPYGWYLYGQPHTERDEVRFMVAGQRDDGTKIYLHPNGKAREQAHHFPTVEKAGQAFERWVARFQNGETSEGETPSEGAGRPSPEEVAQDAAEADSGAQGLINSVSSFARSNPVMFAGAATASGAVVYYLWKEGYFGALISTARTFSPLP